MDLRGDDFCCGLSTVNQLLMIKKKRRLQARYEIYGVVSMPNLHPPRKFGIISKYRFATSESNKILVF